MSRWHTRSTPLLRMTRSRSAIEDCGADAVNAPAFGASVSTKKRRPFGFCESPRLAAWSKLNS